MRYVVIMAGGSGTRLWPLSQQGAPKQLLELFHGKSLLRLAMERAVHLVEPERILVCTGKAYLDEVARQLPEIPRENLLGEPEGRDSLNAAAWPAAILRRRDPDAVMAVLSADHLIEPVENFLTSLNTAFELTEHDPTALVTFGVEPTGPETGFGYLERGDALVDYPDANAVDEFKEKPDLETARKYLDSGRYWWNSGMFVWQAACFLTELEHYLPETHTQLTRLAENPELLAEIYPKLFKTSVDYAIMEPVSHSDRAAHVVAVKLGMTWSDVGSYPVLAQQLPLNPDSSAVLGRSVSLDARNNLLINVDDDSVIAVLGLNDVVVVRTEKVTLVAPLSESQRVKELAGLVAEQVGAEFS